MKYFQNYLRLTELLVISALMTVLLVSCQKKEYPVYLNIIEQLQRLQESLDSSLSFQEGQLKQPAGTSVTYYAAISQAMALYLELQSRPKDTAATVAIATDTDKPHIVRVEKTGGLQIDLSSFVGKIVSITLTTEASSQEGGEIEKAFTWKTIVFRALQPASAQQPTAKAVSTPLPSLENYDVIYLVLDAFHAEHSSLYGYDKPTTPFLDELAKESVVFDNMFANAPYTLASTGILFTSKYAHENGLINEKNLLSPIIPTISELLASKDIPSYLVSVHGYLVGDWGLHRGFTEIIKGNYGHGPGGHPEEAFQDVEKLYERTPKERKFIYIHLGPPHSPYNPPEEYRRFVPDIASEKIEASNENLHKIDNKELDINDEQLAYIIGWYDSNVLYADDLARQMFDMLERTGVLERAIVIVTSDHGEAFMQHHRMVHGSTVFDEMIHIPFLVRFPKELNVTPRRIPHLVSLIDVTPTLAAIYGLEPAGFSGVSILPAIFHDQPVRPFIYTEALVFQDLRAIRDLEHKFISMDNQPLLFHVAEDAHEKNNLADQQPVTTGYYRQLMNAFLQEHPDAMSEKNIDLDSQNPDVIKNLKDLGYIQ